MCGYLYCFCGGFCYMIQQTTKLLYILYSSCNSSLSSVALILLLVALIEVIQISQSISMPTAPLYLYIASFAAQKRAINSWLSCPSITLCSLVVMYRDATLSKLRALCSISTPQRFVDSRSATCELECETLIYRLSQPTTYGAPVHE